MENTPGSVPRASGGFSPEDWAHRIREKLVEFYEIVDMAENDTGWIFEDLYGRKSLVNFNKETGLWDKIVI